ncbi:hypothetical protein BaRGS_00013841 [Batillaria attramentaria]|uniref:Uncharacterized protein n=1 Tax=Batillaria attramentaria TaxID=370345 RepID=A0ABD0L6H3_9CAEN
MINRPLYEIYRAVARAVSQSKRSMVRNLLQVIEAWHADTPVVLYRATGHEITSTREMLACQFGTHTSHSSPGSGSQHASNCYLLGRRARGPRKTTALKKHSSILGHRENR